jgi:hypothetical protein
LISAGLHDILPAMSSCGRFLRLFPVAAGLAMLLGMPSGLFAETVAAMPANKGFATVTEILAKSCSACHDWTGSYESIIGGGRIIAGSPEKSLLYQKIANDQMPMEGDKLTADQKAFIRGWIAAGAPSTELPIAVPAAEGGTAAASAAASAPAPSPGFLFFPNKATFHAVTGFTSSALFLGAGIMGVWHFVNMMNAGHAYRDSIGWNEDTGSQAVRSNEIETAWGNDSALRWWHVGFLAAGETLYLGDAITGISMMTRPQPGKLTKHDIHRYAFFTHAALMVAQIGLGFAETYALSTGQHDLMIGLGATHAVIGLAIPAVMIGAGLENLLLPE